MHDHHTSSSSHYKYDGHMYGILLAFVGSTQLSTFALAVLSSYVCVDSGADDDHIS